MPRRLPNSAHATRPWRIHALTPDFDLEDVWQLDTPGGPDDFPRFVEVVTRGDPQRRAPAAVRALWVVRMAAGKLLRWDTPDSGVGARVASLRERLPEDLRGTPRVRARMFDSLYLLDDEWAGEIANKTVHGLLHLGWVPDGQGGYHAQLAVLVKPNGLLGAAYMAAIRPFRHWIVYPPALRQIEGSWASSASASANNATA
jgi:hypothetical protein